MALERSFLLVLFTYIQQITCFLFSCNSFVTNIFWKGAPMAQANVTLFILSVILMFASVLLLLLLFFLPFFIKRFYWQVWSKHEKTYVIPVLRFTNVFARIHINLLLIFIIFLNLIEFFLMIVDFYTTMKEKLHSKVKKYPNNLAWMKLVLLFLYSCTMKFVVLLSTS